jgi:hypothetical protein
LSQIAASVFASRIRPQAEQAHFRTSSFEIVAGLS